jgi:hypothetical protein
MEALLANPGSTERTRVRRIPELAVKDRSTLHQVLDAGLLGHLALADETGQPYARRRARPRRRPQARARTHPRLRPPLATAEQLNKEDLDP